MELRPGLRLRSATGGVEVVVVRGPASSTDVLACAGEPMNTLEDAEPVDSSAPGEADVRLGKRYEHASTGLELLCTKGGPGPLTFGGELLGEKGAKPLPSSD